MSEYNKNPLVVVPAKSTTPASTGGYFPSSSSSSYSYGYSQAPEKVFSAAGIEFWGGARTKIEDNLVMDETDLIVNCSGTELVNKPFIKKSPKWLHFEGGNQSEVPQLLLDWKDMSPPPETINLAFWEDIVRQAKDNGIKRIICCCLAGQGRTGTALSAFMLATGIVNEPDEAIEFLRTTYNSSAVEKSSQEIYLYNLVYDLESIFKDIESIDSDDLPSEI